MKNLFFGRPLHLSPGSPEPEVQNPLDERFVPDPGVGGGLSEILAVHQLWIRVDLDHVRLPVAAHSQIHPPVARQA